MNRRKFLVALAAVVLSTIPASAQTVNATSQGQAYEHLWSVGVGAGRANEG